MYFKGKEMLYLYNSFLRMMSCDGETEKFALYRNISVGFCVNAFYSFRNLASPCFMSAFVFLAFYVIYVRQLFFVYFLCFLFYSSARNTKVTIYFEEF